MFFGYLAIFFYKLSFVKQIFIEISISVSSLFSRKSYNRFWSGALKLA